MSFQPETSLQSITLLGADSPGGSYILRIQLNKAISVVFGKFKSGKPIPLPAADYIYIGSAMGNSSALARRLLRHATRSGRKRNQSIRESLIKRFGNFVPKAGKRLHWNIDYLLDQGEAKLTHVIAIQSRRNFEINLANFLEKDHHTAIIEKGLGANDISGNTHVLYVTADEFWWKSLSTRLADQLGIPCVELIT